jgi:hypothetical protein
MKPAGEALDLLSFQNTPFMSSPSVETNAPISSLASSLLVRADEGRTLHAFGHGVIILLDGKQTGEKFTAFLNVTPPEVGPDRTTTKTKTNGSISSKEELAFC